MAGIRKYICPKCKVSDKYKNYSYCLDCKRAIHKKHFLENKERNYELNRKWRERNKEKLSELRKNARMKMRLDILTHYSGGTPKCNCCGEQEIKFLAIDHINNDGAEKKRNGEPKGGTGFYHYIVKNNFPDGLQVLCHNCNNAKAFYGKCPHVK